MGTQILIKHQDMLDAGWVRESETHQFTDMDDEGNEFENTYTVMYYRKGIERMSTYSYSDYCWDSKFEGGNRIRQKRLGLLELKHEFI